MGMHISSDQNLSSVNGAIEMLDSRFAGTGIDASLETHSSGKKSAFVRIVCPPRHWAGLAKFLRFDLSVNHCSLITGTHFPEGTEERGWEVAYHMMRMPISNPVPRTCIIHDAKELDGVNLPLEIEVFVPLPIGTSPSIATVQHLWKGADWNEKETWDLVGIQFEGHEGMMRVLNPHDSPPGFHPLQKQHKLRYDGHNEMYDDAQGFSRNPVDVGKVK